MVLYSWGTAPPLLILMDDTLIYLSQSVDFECINTCKLPLSSKRKVIYLQLLTLEWISNKGNLGLLFTWKILHWIKLEGLLYWLSVLTGHLYNFYLLDGITAKVEDIRCWHGSVLLQYKCCLFVQAIRNTLLLGHRQAFAWIDEWYGMTLEDVRDYESGMQEKTNEKIREAQKVRW